mgnify:FL=1
MTKRKNNRSDYKYYNNRKSRYHYKNKKNREQNINTNYKPLINKIVRIYKYIPRIDLPTDIVKYKMDDISSLIDVVVKLYKDPKFHTKNYSFNVKGIYDAIGALEEFNSLIGMKSAKKEMLRFIKCYSQPLFINSNRRDIKYDKKLNYHGQTQLKVDTSTIYNKNGKFR